MIKLGAEVGVVGAGNVVRYADDFPSPEKWEACKAYIVTLDDEEVIRQAANVLNAIHNDNVASYWAMGDLKARMRLEDILGELHCRIAVTQVKKRFGQVLEKQAREIDLYEQRDYGGLLREGFIDETDYSTLQSVNARVTQTTDQSVADNDDNNAEGVAESENTSLDNECARGLAELKPAYTCKDDEQLMLQRLAILKQERKTLLRQKGDLDSEVVDVAQFADGANSQETWDACQQYIAALKADELMPQVGNVLKSLHGWNLHGWYGRDEIQIIAELRAVLSDLIGRIGEEQVKTHFAELLKEQKRELRTLEVEDGCCTCEIEDESEPFFHIYTDDEVRAMSDK